MSMLAFFPWMTLPDAISVGEFELIPYRRGHRPSAKVGESGLQETLDAVLEPFRNVEHPLHSCVLVTTSARSLTDDLTEEVRSDFFAFAELLALSGVAARSLFTWGGYTNRDNFRLVIQAFDDPESGAAVLTRRRDGSARNVMPRNSYVVRKPEHVGSANETAIDEPLLSALLESRGHGIWERLYEACLGFNLANTDRNEMAEEAEGILLVGALERLLNCAGGKEHQLASRFSDRLAPRNSRQPTDGSLPDHEIIERFRHSQSLRDVWIRDFFRLRGNFAHGKMESRYSPLWTLKNHLLFASFIFPFVVKYELGDAGLYELSDRDQEWVDMFEDFLTRDHFSQRGDPYNPASHPWNQIREEAMHRRMRGIFSEGIQEMFDQAPDEDATPDG